MGKVTICITTSCAGTVGSFAAGEVITVEDAVAKDLLKGGLAVPMAKSDAQTRQTAIHPSKQETRKK